MSRNDRYPDIFDTADKKLRFTVTDVGEFIDGVYREQETSQLFSKLIGRQFVVPQSKKEFTAADVVCEGYLYKKGSWVKNWKRRYFILRKDIRALHYYSSREDMTLLGSIDLASETNVINVRPDDPIADGFQNVVGIESANGTTDTKIYIRFETFEKMKAWMVDIQNESQNMVFAEDEPVNWWDALYQYVEPIEAKHHQKRGAVGGEHDADDMPKLTKDITPMSSPAVSKRTAGNSTDGTISGETGKLLSSGPVDSDDESDHEDGGHGSESRPGAERRFSSNSQHAAMSNRFLKKIKLMKPDKKPYGPPPFEDPTAKRYEIIADSSQALSGLQFSLKLSNICTYHDRLIVVVYGSVPHGSGPHSGNPEGNSSSATPSSAKKTIGGVPTATMQQIASSSQSWQVICRTEAKTVVDRPLYSESFIGEVKIFFNTLGFPNIDEYKDIKIHVFRIDNESNKANKDHGRSTASGATSGQQSLLAKCVIAKRVFDFKPPLKIKMKVIQPPIMDIAVPQLKEPEVLLGIVKLTSFQLDSYRHWFQSTLKTAPYSEILYSFGSNTGLTLSIEQLFASRYSTACGLAMVSFWYKEREAQYRAIRDEVAEHLRRLDAEVHEPASLVLASAAAAMTLSSSAGNGLSMSASMAAAGSSAASTTGVSLPPHILEEKKKELETARHALESMDELCVENNELASLVIHEYHNATRGVDVMNNVIGTEVGGGVLRRSTWKKVTVWQYCTTNLNLHLLTSRVYSFHEVLEAETVGSGSQHRRMHCVPTITLGCPAAHELKFHDGGLRRIFHEVPSAAQKLVWMQALQHPDLSQIETLFQAYPKEANAIFGLKLASLQAQHHSTPFNNSNNNHYAPSASSSTGFFARFTAEEKAQILKRKHDLAKRLDICATQALGCAVMNIRTILLLATKVGGTYLDVLARSLKVGFLVAFESMLSMQGHEIGMIEDLEMSALWLALVTVRLVVPLHDIHSSANAPGDTSSSGSNSPAFLSSSPGVPHTQHHHRTSRYRAADGDATVGVGEGVSCRRDLNGRLIVDLEISAEEADTVAEALSTMVGFPARHTRTLPQGYAFSFNPEPRFASHNNNNNTGSSNTSQSNHRANSSNTGTTSSLRVAAVVEVFGLTFTQGVNEMQTLANLSASRDNAKQGEINLASLGRLREYYTNGYKPALAFQLDSARDKLADFILTANHAANAGTSTASMSVPSGPGAASSSGASGPAGGGRGGLNGLRRKSLRNSIFLSAAAQPAAATVGGLGGGQAPQGHPYGPLHEAVERKVEQFVTKVLQHNDRLLDQLEEAVRHSQDTPHEKHVDILLRSSAICRQIGGITSILCKSGKDRTSMGVTLENTRSLVEDLGVLGGRDCCDLMRQQGVRRMNVYANTGQSMFAFNQIQRRALPLCYRPPPGTFAGNVVT